MKKFLPTIILRHRKENLKKCSLRGLESRTDLNFLTYPKDPLPDLSQYIMLDFDGPPLTPDDAHLGLFLIDATWRLSEKMARVHAEHLPPIRRSLPKTLLTAYPRRQDDCADPARGLATVEALYAAHHILKRPQTETLLDGYHWAEQFLAQNPAF